MQRGFPDSPLHVPSLHFVIAIEEKGDAADGAGVEECVDGESRDDVEAKDCDGGKDERGCTEHRCDGYGSMAGSRSWYHYRGARR